MNAALTAKRAREGAERGTPAEEGVHPMAAGRAACYESLPLFMTPKELAAVMGEHVGSVRRGIAAGRIPADKVNGRWRICRDVVFPNAKREVGLRG